MKLHDILKESTKERIWEISWIDEYMDEFGESIPVEHVVYLMAFTEDGAIEKWEENFGGMYVEPNGATELNELPKGKKLNKVYEWRWDEESDGGHYDSNYSDYDPGYAYHDEY